QFHPLRGEATVRTRSISGRSEVAASPFPGIARRGFRLRRTGRSGGGASDGTSHRPDMEGPVELDARESAGISLQFLGAGRTCGLSVVAHDLGRAEGVEIVVEPAEALEVFTHPYAYVRSS